MRRMQTLLVLFLGLLYIRIGMAGEVAGGGIDALPAVVADAKPGEWASYKYAKDLFDGVQVEIKVTVLGFSDEGGARQVRARVDTTLDGEVGKSSDQVHPVADSFFLLKNFRGAELEFSPAVIPIPGGEVVGIEAAGEWQGYPLSIFVSEELPALGLARVIWGSETLLELTEYGFAQ